MSDKVGDKMSVLKTGRYNIYFRLLFTKYYIARDTEDNVFCLMYKIWDEDWGNYRWKI